MAQLNFFKKLSANLFNKEAIDPNTFKVNVSGWDESSTANAEQDPAKAVVNPYANPNLPFNERAKLVQQRIDDCRASLINLKK